MEDNPLYSQKHLFQMTRKTKEMILKENLLLNEYQLL